MTKKAKVWKPKDVGLIDQANKVAAFDQLYNLACGCWNDPKDRLAAGDDDSHWHHRFTKCYEAVMQLLDIEKEEGEPTIWDRMRERDK